MNNSHYFKMDYEECDEFIMINCNWSDERYSKFFNDSLLHFLEMNFDNREEISYLKTSYELRKWYSIFFSKRNQHICEEVISWSIEHNCWIFKEQIGNYTATHKARNSAAFCTYYSYFIKDYKNLDFDREHYLRNFKPVPAPTQEQEVQVIVNAVVEVTQKQKTTQQSIWKRIFASLRSIII